MKKFILTILLSFTALFAFADRHIYFPVYVANVEVFNGDSLVQSTNILGQDHLNIPMMQEGCEIKVETSNYNECIKNSVRNRRLSNLYAVSGVINTVNSALNMSMAANSNYVIPALVYMSNSYFYSTEAYKDFAIMEYTRKQAETSLAMPVTCKIINNSDKILRGTNIVKPNEIVTLSHTNYCDEWRISDNQDNVYCIRFMAMIVRTRGIISREEQKVYIPNGKTSYEDVGYGTTAHYDVINTQTYEVLQKDILANSLEFKTFKSLYKRDKGYDK